jgi:selenocysteine lyase/cysteine desulfurase
MTDSLNPLIAPAAPPRGIYLNNAATGLMTAPVLDTVLAHLRREAEIGGMEAALEAHERLEAVHASAARLLNANVDEIAFADGGNRGLHTLLGAVPLAPGDRVLVPRAEWGGSLATLALRPGVHVEAMPVDDCGRVDVAATRAIVDRRVKLILLSWCPATNGLIQPAAEIGALAAEAGATYLIDACQAVGQLPVDVAALRCHGLVASGRKWLRGPRGTAIVYTSRAFVQSHAPFSVDQTGAAWLPEQRDWQLRADARRFQYAEHFVAGRLGLGAAIDGALTLGIDTLRGRIDALATRLRAGLAQIAGVSVHDRGTPLSGIVTFNLAGKSAGEVRTALAARGVSVNAVADFYAPLDMQARGLEAVVRAAPHAFIDNTQIDAAVRAVAAIAAVA